MSAATLRPLSRDSVRSTTPLSSRPLTRPFDPADREQLFLYSYRAVARELHQLMEAAQESKRHGTAQPSQCGQQAQHLPDPWYWRNDYVAVEQWSGNIVRDHYKHLIALHGQHVRFAKTWDNNPRLQGFLEAFTDKSIPG
jgi:uncharacterized protein DUF6908